MKLKTTEPERVKNIQENSWEENFEEEVDNSWQLWRPLRIPYAELSNDDYVEVK